MMDAATEEALGRKATSIRATGDWRARPMAMRYQKRPPSFAVGEVFAVKHMGWVFFARVVRHDGDKAHVVSLPEGGFDAMDFQRKPSAGTRAMMSRESTTSLVPA